MKSISRSVISGTYSVWLTNSSPIAIGIDVCWRSIAELADVLRRERVFEEEELELLQLLRQPDRLDRRDPLVDVVQQLDLVAERERRCSNSLGTDARSRRDRLPGALFELQMRRLRARPTRDSQRRRSE